MIQHQDIPGPLLLVGCGKMGGALLAGWLAGGLDPEHAVVVEPNKERAREIGSRHGITAVTTPAAVDAGFKPRFVLLAVKPQMMAEALPAYVRFAGPDTVYLSIAAGTPIAAFKSAFGDNAVIVRAMPNTPAAVGRGMSVLCADAQATAAQKSGAEALMAAVGETGWVEDEELMHAVTALSGGGPAYVFLLAETMEKAGVAAGLPEKLSARLARVTVAGAGELLHQANDAPSQLRINVTSPKGTTEQALKVLMADDGLQPLYDKAIQAAANRSRELSE